MTYEQNQYLVHYGISGQRWGIRRYQNEDNTLTEEGKARYNKQADKDTVKVHKEYEDFNDRISKEIHSAFSDKEIKETADGFIKYLEKAYGIKPKDIKIDGKTFDELPDDQRFYYGYMLYQDLSHDGFDSDYLMHYGVSGQKRGVRRYQTEDGKLTEEGKRHYGYYDKADGTKDWKRLEKDAKNDAKEYAKAQAYYGEGAGIRRKQIKNLTSERMKDKDYKKAFEDFLSKQNMSEIQKSANRERKTRDAYNYTAKTARGVKNFITGFGSVSLSALAIGYTLQSLKK